MTRIESRQNGTLRHLARLAREKKYRQAAGEMVCEGRKMLYEAVTAGAKIKAVLLRDGTREPLAEQAAGRGALLYTAADHLFETASSLETPQDVIFSCESPVLSGTLPAVRTAILLEGVQDPGNIGTIMRSADAFGLGALILCEGCADPTAPKVLRGTMGAVFRQPVYKLPLQRAAEFLRGQGLPLYAAVLRADSVPVTRLSLGRCAAVVGSEGHGVSPETLEFCDKNIVIPMVGGAESLNAGVAASILIWEMQKAAERAE